MQAWVSCSGGWTPACDPHALGDQCGEQRGSDLKHSTTSTTAHAIRHSREGMVSQVLTGRFYDNKAEIKALSNSMCEPTVKDTFYKLRAEKVAHETVWLVAATAESAWQKRLRRLMPEKETDV